VQIALLSGAVPLAEYQLGEKPLLALWRTASGHMDLKATACKGARAGAEETSGAGHDTRSWDPVGKLEVAVAMIATGSGQVMRRAGSFHRIPLAVPL